MRFTYSWKCVLSTYKLRNKEGFDEGFPCDNSGLFMSSYVNIFLGRGTQ